MSIIVDRPTGFVMYCDDLRLEASGKLIYVGAYTGDMTFFGEPPTAILNLFVVFQYFEPLDECEDSVKFMVKASWQVDPLLEFEIMPQGPRPVTPPPKTPIEFPRRLFGGGMPLGSFEIPEEGRLTATFHRGTDIIPGGSMQVLFNPPPGNTSSD